MFTGQKNYIKSFEYKYRLFKHRFKLMFWNLPIFKQYREYRVYKAVKNLGYTVTIKEVSDKDTQFAELDKQKVMIQPIDHTAETFYTSVNTSIDWSE